MNTIIFIKSTVNFLIMVDYAFYRVLGGEPSSERTRNEIELLESCLSKYNPENVGGFSVGKRRGETSYKLKDDTLVHLTVQGNLSFVTVEAEGKSNGLLGKLKDFYKKIRLPHYN